ncbi:MAG: ion transporter [Clostridiaceae bacterium]|nr:ion transporter [Clostridiaceae bacterium]
MKNIKRTIYNILDKSEQNGLAEKIFDIMIISLIILNVVAVICEPSIKDPNALAFLKILEIVSVIIFTIEYLLRIWVADLSMPQKNKWKARFLFILTPMAIIDLLAILPFYIPFIIPVDLRVLRMLRVFRLLRIFKANRYTSALTTVFRVIKNKAEQLISSLFVVIVLMIIASVLMFNIENYAQPEKFVSVFDAMWWSVATLTTVGYGDIYPITLAGKLLAAIIAILGIGIVAIPTGIIASGFTELVHQKNEQNTRICPHCGKEID